MNHHPEPNIDTYSNSRVIWDFTLGIPCGAPLIV